MYESLVLYFLMFLVVAISIGRIKSGRDFFGKLGFKKINVEKELPLAVVYVAVLVAVSVVIGFIFWKAGLSADAEKVSEAIKTIKPLEVFIILSVASVVEEIFFRGFLQRKTNLLFASFVFSYFHIIYGSVAELVGTFFMGLVLGKEYQQTKSLFAPIVSHFLYNMITVAILFGGI